MDQFPIDETIFHGRSAWLQYDYAPQDEVHRLDPAFPTERDPHRRKYLRKEIMQLRDDLREGSLELVIIRRAKLRRLLVADAIQQVLWMRDLGFDYIPTQP